MQRRDFLKASALSMAGAMVMPKMAAAAGFAAPAKSK